MNTEECSGLDLACQAEEAAGGLVDTVATSALEQLAAEVATSLDRGMALVATMWTQTPTPSLVTGTGGAASAEIAFVQDSLGIWTFALAVLSILVGAGRMAWEQRAEPGRDLLRSIITFVLVVSISLAVIERLVVAMDLLAEWIITRATSGTTFAVNIASLFITTNTEEIGVLLFVVMGFFALIGALVQIILMIVRGGMLVLLAGVLPTTAAFTNTRIGQQWFDRSVGWLIAFILYKPVAAIIYALAFRLAGDPSTDPTGSIDFLSGLTLMALALIAMPALMRFCTPLVAAVASGSGGSSGALAGAATVTAASGAVHAGRALSSSGSSSGGSGGGAPGPNGATGTGSSGPSGSDGPTGAPGGAGSPGAPAAGGTTAAAAAPSAAAGTASTAAAGTAGAATAAATGPPGWAAAAAGAAVSGAQQGAAAVQRGAQAAAENGESP